MTYSLKNVKTFRGMEGQGFNATLYRDGQRIGTVDDAGQGGCLDFHFSDHSHPFGPQAHGEGAKLRDYCEALPEQPAETIEGMWHVEARPETPDSFICDLFDAFMRERDLTRLLKKIVMKVPGDAVGEFRTFPAKFPPTPANLATAAAKNPDAIILNRLAFAEALAIYSEAAA